MASSGPTTQPPVAPTQLNTQWVTPALLVSLLALLAVVSFGLLADLRGLRAELRADFRDSQAELRADFRDLKQEVKTEIQTAIGGVNTRMDAMAAEIKEIKASNREINGRIDQVYQLLLPAKQ